MGEVVCGPFNRDVGLEGAGKAAALNSESSVACTGIEETLRHGIGEGDSLFGSRSGAVDVLKIAERGRSAFSYQSEVRSEIPVFKGLDHRIDPLVLLEIMISSQQSPVVVQLSAQRTDLRQEGGLIDIAETAVAEEGCN